MQLVVLLVMLLLCMTMCTANKSIFLLGDSVSQRLVQKGFTPLFNCTEADPKISFTAETSDVYTADKGLLCHENNITRVGFTIHFGVFDADYHKHWTTHKAHGSSNNSRTNILQAVHEFQHRTEGTDDTVVFMFHSAAWDMLRYLQHTHLYQNYNDWLDHYQDKYTTLMEEILKTLRPQDQLVIATMHEMLEVDIRPLNERAKRVARRLHIPMFDQAALLGPKKAWYLIDGTHQSAYASMIIARSILAGNYTLLPEQVRRR